MFVPPRLLKWLRVAVALFVFAGITAALVDFRGLIPASTGHQLAAVQFVPSIVALAVGAGLSLACIVILLTTLAVGRVYCSVLCPLGILQDVVIRLRQWLLRKSRLLPYTRPHVRTRTIVLLGTIILAFAWHAGFVLGVMDPYSNFGRIASAIFRPLVARANNLAVDLTAAMGWQGLYRVDLQWAAAGALAGPLVVLVLVVVMAAWRGRLYCNTICPVGTLLGHVSEWALFRLGIDQGACQKCGDCLRVCKAQCIELRSGTIDFSRCVACYNCVDICQHHGINYRFKWKRVAKTDQPDSSRHSDGVHASLSLLPSAGEGRKLLPPPAFDWQRRAFLARATVGLAAVAGVGGLLMAEEPEPEEPRGHGRGPGHGGGQGHGQGRGRGRHGGRHAPVVCPPGAGGIEQFLARCTGCHLCISACPTHVLQPAFLEYGLLGLMKPRMDYQTAFCNFDCVRCGEVCPDGAISLLSLADKHVTSIGEVRFDREKCVVVTNGTDCAACSEHCPTKAVYTTPYGNNLRLPTLATELCIGCGACEYACPVRPQRAIIVVGNRQHGRAEIKVEPKATLPSAGGDFPF